MGAAVALIAVPLLVFAVFSFRREWRMPVRVKGFDEVACVLGVVWWASRDPAIRAKLPYANLLKSAASGWWWARLPQSELVVLVPFIDATIDGRGPALNQPLEYEDYRPRVLAAFKSRMKSEGRWPDTPSPL